MSLAPSSLVEAAKVARRHVRALARTDRSLFARMVLGTELQPFHRSWLSFQDSNPRSLLMAPRGHGKTTVADVLFVLWRLLGNPNERVLIVSNTMNQARAFLREIAGQLEREEVRDIWGDLRGSRWTESEIELLRSRIAKEPSITATGAGGAIISRHYDTIICDDIIDEENSMSATQREKTRVWFFKTLLPCLEPDGRIHVIGTRWHYGDLYGELMKLGWATRIDRAVAHDGTALWPEKFSATLLTDLRRQAGDRIFNCQYQNDPSGYEGAIFKHRHMKYHEGDALPQGLKVFCAADLAISTAETADYFALATVGLAPDGRIFVLDCERARLSFHEQVQFIISRAALHKPIRIGVESVAYQRALAQELSRRAALPVVELKGQKDKVTRAWKLAAHFEAGRIVLPRSCGELVEELERFPSGAHDDMVDALGYAVELAAGLGDFVVKPW